MQEWLTSQPFQLPQWLEQSLDLKHFEHLWALLKRCLDEFSTPSRGIQELWERVCLVCPNFSENDCMLYESMQ